MAQCYQLHNTYIIHRTVHQAQVYRLAQCCITHPNTLCVCVSVCVSVAVVQRVTGLQWYQ